ncbi:hypothetical protein ACIRNI_04400 [Streptomyces sp. NPDC093546]|uniref:hypothetical protein n=1 Tax=Streptomyces sp. NPDC093546 TaxID=3366040 RepID=UPI00380C97E0
MELLVRAAAGISGLAAALIVGGIGIHGGNSAVSAQHGTTTANTTVLAVPTTSESLNWD